MVLTSLTVLSYGQATVTGYQDSGFRKGNPSKRFQPQAVDTIMTIRIKFIPVILSESQCQA